MTTKKTKRAVILTADKFEDMEVFFPMFRLLEEGWQVDIAGVLFPAVASLRPLYDPDNARIKI